MDIIKKKNSQMKMKIMNENENENNKKYFYNIKQNAPSYTN